MTSAETAACGRPRLAPGAVALASGFVLVLLLASIVGPYGWFIDELYYLAYAQRLAALCVCASPMAMVLGSFFSMNAFELLLWPLAALVLVRILEEDRRRWWLPFGALMGLGLLNKHTTVLFMLAVGAALLLVPARRHLLTPWPWLGGLLALVMLAPNLAWQHAH